MISSGWQILRFVKMATARTLVDVMFMYKFTADSLSGEHIDFVYKINEFGQLPQIIQDLIHLTQRKWWINVLLEEQQGMLMIKGIREPSETQEELTLRSEQLRKGLLQ